MILVCALCGSHDPWYVAVNDATSELPLKKGDLVCGACAEKLPKLAQDVLVWASNSIRARHCTDGAEPATTSATASENTQKVSESVATQLPKEK